tara:strand:- start:334 stop:594 length:261 start_codon:yes stop_codon:yes gene_type:complete
MAREFIEVTRAGVTLVDGKAIGKRKWIGEAIADFSLKKELVLNCATKEEYEEKAFESLSGYARKNDLEIGPVNIDWSMPMEEYRGK